MNLDSLKLEPLLLLMVEDSQLDAEIVFRNLRKVRLANRLIHLKDGAQALDYLLGNGEYADRTRHPLPQLLLLDLNLPRVSGWEILDALAGQDGLKDIPVVALTSSELDDENIKRRGQRHWTSLAKPLDFDRLHKALLAQTELCVVLARRVTPVG